MSLFGNRRLGWKLAAALAAIAGLGLLSWAKGRSIHPSLWRCMAQPARWDGAGVWLSPALVTASDAGGFEIEMAGVRARVAPAAPVAPGETVALTGTFTAQGPLIRAKEVRKVAESSGSRTLSVAVSIAAVLLVLLNFLRHFAFRPKVAQVEGVD